MEFRFSNEEEYYTYHDCAHSAILYWRKMRQAVEGKITLYVSPLDKPHYTVEYCNEQMARNALILREIEQAWGEESESTIIGWCLKQHTA